MMDYLRRLAPPRETDTSRAVAMLPARFAGENPLWSMASQARSTQRRDDDETSLSLDATSPSAVANPVAAVAVQRDSVARVTPSPAIARPLDTEQMHRNKGAVASPIHSPIKTKATSPIRVPATALDMGVLVPKIPVDQRGANSEHARLRGPEPQAIAAVFDARPHFQGMVTAPSQPHVALPLSQSTIAQRTPQPRDDNQVVHVTIGRIDVVANTTPAPTPRRTAVPRQPTVTLADYLRAGNGSR